MTRRLSGSAPVARFPVCTVLSANSAACSVSDSSLPTIAILTSSYNRLSGLRRLHASLQRQSTSLGWVHIIVDDASPSRFLPTDIASDVSRIHFEQMDVNQGPLVARNLAIDRGLSYRPDLLAFVDDDDFVTDDFFDYVASEWNARREIGWFVSRSRFGESAAPSAGFWPDHDGIFDWFDDMQLNRKFDGDVMHVISAERMGTARFSTWGRYQREWTLLARLAKRGGFYATSRITKVSHYAADGMTLNKRGFAPDLASCWNYISKPAVLVLARPNMAQAWTMLGRQVAAFPVRLALLASKALQMWLGKIART